MRHRRRDFLVSESLWLAPVTVLALLLLSAFRLPSESREEGAVDVEMRNVMYHFTAQIAILIPRLEGLLLPTRRGDMPFFDDNQSFILAIRSAEISITTDAMANVLNQHVFAADDSPLKEITITSQGNSLNLRGKVHSKGDVSFETEGTLSVNDTGEIRIHSDRIRAAHLPVKGLMDLLGVKIASLINTNKVEGVRVDRNDLIVNPEQILPPPRIRGRLTAVQLRGNEIVLYFGAKAVASSKQPFQNYMAFHGARLKFGKLTMNDTDMVLIDMDTRDPFDFYLHHYKEQLVARLYQDYTKTTRGFGLRVFMRDFNKLPPHSAAGN